MENKALKEGLKQILKQVKYKQYPDIPDEMMATLGNQFTDYALDQIVEVLIDNGVVVDANNKLKNYLKSDIHWDNV